MVSPEKWMILLKVGAMFPTFLVGVPVCTLPAFWCKNIEPYTTEPYLGGSNRNQPPRHTNNTATMEAEGHKDQSGFTNKQGCHKDGNSKTQIGQEGILLLQFQAVWRDDSWKFRQLPPWKLANIPWKSIVGRWNFLLKWSLFRGYSLIFGWYFHHPIKYKSTKVWSCHNTYQYPNLWDWRQYS